MDGQDLLWIESLPTAAVAELNDVLCKHSMNTGYYPGKTEESWWKIYVAIVDELQLRNKVWMAAR